MTVYNTPGMGSYGSTWQHAGYSGAGNVEDLFGSLRGQPAVICGNGRGVFEELNKTMRLLGESTPVVFGVNDVGMYLPRMDHWVSLHYDNLRAWKTVRWLTPREQEKVRYHSVDGDQASFIWTGLNPLFALSGYFAMQIAYLMGADLIVLCGCPGDSTPRFFDDGLGLDYGRDGLWEQVAQECHRVPELKERVRSMSGRTRDFFGGI